MTVHFERIEAMSPSQLMTVINHRHSIRRYRLDPLDDERLDVLRSVIERCNALGHLKMELRLNDPDPFRSWLSHYGMFTHVQHYIALIGEKASDLEERIGYYGEAVILQATALGLGTCWVAGTYDKRQSRVNLSSSDELIGVITIGFAKHPGSSRKTKSVVELSQSVEPMPAWFEQGMRAVQKAPTAMNQQKFQFITDGTNVWAKPGLGFYTKLDLGIAKLHFEIGAGALFFGYPLLSLPNNGQSPEE